MTRQSRAKSDGLQIGSSLINASDLSGLKRAWEQNQLVLFVGAGISVDYGVPSWKDLVLEMLFDQTEHAGRLKALLPHYRRALAEWLADYFEYNPIILARVIQDTIRAQAKKTKGLASGDPFLENLRHHLYAAYRINARATALGVTTLAAVAAFVCRSVGKIDAIVNFNFDNLLEEELTRLNVNHDPVLSDTRRIPGKLRIIHPHGFIPRYGALESGKLVFTERDYHGLTDAMFHWALTEIVSYLRHRTVLFIGMSMSDPSLRRLLDVGRNSKIPQHWQIQKRHEIRDHEERETRESIQRRARKWGEILDERGRKGPGDLSAIINSALRQADTYDRRLFEQMGVKTIWLKDFSDIPALLRAIA